MMQVRNGLLFVAGLMLLGPILAETIRPTELAPYVEEGVELSDLLPRAFGDWQEINTQAIVRPPEEERNHDSPYDQELYRVYRNKSGEVVMLVIAFGHNQSDAIQLHRPEICYAANGFAVSNVQDKTIMPSVESTHVSIPSVQLTTSRIRRQEPVTYWTRVGANVTSDPLMLQLEKLWTGLKGQIPDGALVRISSLGDYPETEFALHEKFVGDLLAATGDLGRAMLIGERAERLASLKNTEATGA